ncbi:MAG: Hsp20/alpha crystallin family protein [Candidatus Eisenbacteria sp.]|nr:Hsp20/alpha crystallin family protein [Candidatus Eisenbacteria bacterium]
MSDPKKRDEGADMEDFVEGLLSHYALPRTPVMVSAKAVWRPATDVYETEDAMVIRMDVSGMGRDHFEITVEGDDVLIRGQRKDPTPPGRKHFYKMEINVGPFERRIRIPVPFDAEGVTASYENGFLELRMAKSDKPPPKKITIDIE